MEHDRKKNRIAIFRITDRCNQDCVFCCQQGRGLGSEPGLDQIKRDMDGLLLEGICNVVFMHGETLLRKDFSQIAEYCREAGFDRIGVATNGIRLADADFLEKILSCGVNSFEISIHSHIEEAANRISRRRFTWAKQKQALENLSSVQHRLVSLKLNTVVCRHNADHISELADYFFGHITSPYPVMMLKYPYIMGAASADAGEIYPYDELNLQSFLAHAGKHNYSIKLENMPLCIVPGHEHLVIETTDRVINIEYYSRLDGEETYQNKSVRDTSRVLLEECGSCTIASLCRGVDCRYIEIFGMPGLRASKADPHDIVRRILG